jgi:hypothetical protein
MADQGFRIEYGDRASRPAENMECGGIVTVGTTAVELTFTRTPIRSIVITSLTANSGTIYIGKSNVASDGSNSFLALSSGDKVDISYNDVTNPLYAIASAANQFIIKGALY